MLEVPFAEKNIPTFHPILFRAVKEFLLEKKYKTPFDYAILLHLQENPTISTETISAYIAQENISATVEQILKLLR